MKAKKLSTILFLGILSASLCLTACDNSDGESSFEESSSVPTSSSTESSSPESSSTETSSDIESSSSVEASSSEAENSSQHPESKYPEEFTGYVGETLYGADAVKQYEYGRLDFEGFTYVRWAAPFFDNTLKTPDLVNWDTYEMPKYDGILTQKDPKWFVVKPGDKLENGLVVKSAHCSFQKSTYVDGTTSINQSDSEVVFEEKNTLTLTGVLYCTPDIGGYMTEGDLYFCADPTNSLIPVIDYNHNSKDKYYLQKAFFSNAAFLTDGFYFRVGNIDTDEIDLSGIIKKGGICEVTVTLDNIRLNAGGYGGVNGAFGNIVSIEKVSR